jgi:hypothetical protein
VHDKNADPRLLEIALLVLDLSDWLDLGGTLPRRWSAARINR